MAVAAYLKVDRFLLNYQCRVFKNPSDIFSKFINVYYYVHEGSKARGQVIQDGRDRWKELKASSHEKGMSIMADVYKKGADKMNMACQNHILNPPKKQQDIRSMFAKKVCVGKGI